MSPGRTRRGVALMLVLWLIVVMSAVAATVGATTRTELNAVANFRAQAVGRYAAESGLVLATARVDSLLATASSEQQWVLLFHQLDARLADLQEASLGSARFGVAVTDLSARLDVNHASATTLTRLAAQFTDGRHAERAVASLEDWKDRDDLVRPSGAETNEYARSGSLFVPSNGPLGRLEELGRIIGFGDSLAAALAPYLTVHGDSRVNVNGASEPVLAALPGMTPAAARAIVSRREAGETILSVDPMFEQLGRENALLISPIPTRILIISRGWMDGHPLTHEIQAVYRIDGHRLRLYAWQERDL